MLFSEIKKGLPLSLLLTSLIHPNLISAQAGEFTVRGFAHTSFIWQEHKSTFGDMALVPIFLWGTDKILVESELELALVGAHGASVGLGYMTLHYDLTPNLRVQAGKMLLPFGIFGPRLHPSWINKLPTPPLGFGHDDLSPMADLGVGLRGVKPMGKFRFGHSAYVVNGPQLKKDTTQAGMIEFGIEDNNTGKAVGGRLELAHLSEGSWEVGLSGIWGDAGPENFESIAALGALDLSYQRASTLLHGIVDLKSQINWIQVDREEYGTGITFKNQNWNYTVQLAYRPSSVDAQWIRNMEVVGRFGQLQYAPDAPWSKEGTEISSGLNYWLNWNSLVKVAWVTGGGGHEEAASSSIPGGHEGHGGAASTAEPSHGFFDEFSEGKLVIQMAIGL